MIEQAAANGWDVITTSDGSCTAAIKGTEIHVEFHRAGAITRQNIREVLGPLLEREGYATTRVPHGDERSKRFVERMQFAETWGDENYAYYILTALPFSKE